MNLSWTHFDYMAPAMTQLTTGRQHGALLPPRVYVGGPSSNYTHNYAPSSQRVWTTIMPRVSANHNMAPLGRILVRTTIMRGMSAYYKDRLGRAGQRVWTIITLGVSAYLRVRTTITLVVCAYHNMASRRGQHNQARTTITPCVCAYHNMVRLSTASGYGQLTRRG